MAAVPSGWRRIDVWLWVLAVLLTVTAAVYQRLVGPTRPVRGVAQVAGQEIRYKLIRSYGHEREHAIHLRVPDPQVHGFLAAHRFRTKEPWTIRRLVRDGAFLVGTPPEQAPGGKVSYRIFLHQGAGPGDLEAIESDGIARVAADLGATALPPAGPIVLRWKGHVPLWIVIPHVFLVFFGMLWANRAGLEALRRTGEIVRLTRWSLLLLGVGGLVLGPIMQWKAFGDAWTGIPFGWDLTDNKTLIAVLAWVAAWLAVRRAGQRGDAWRARGWVIGAALVTLIVFSIPHSVLGTELDYETGQRIIAR